MPVAALSDGAKAKICGRHECPRALFSGNGQAEVESS